MKQRSKVDQNESHLRKLDDNMADRGVQKACQAFLEKVQKKTRQAIAEIHNESVRTFVLGQCIELRQSIEKAAKAVKQQEGKSAKAASGGELVYYVHAQKLAALSVAFEERAWHIAANYLPLEKAVKEEVKKE